MLKGTVANHATVASDESAAGFDTNPANNNASLNTTVRTRADIAVTSKTPSSPTVNVRDPFTYTIVVQNNVGAGLAEADNVVVSDSLPANMVLTGTPSVSLVSGTTTQSTCTGAGGGTSFSCSLGTVSNGAVVHVTVPVRLNSVSSYPQTFTNTASVTTSSLDPVPGNNSASGSVSVNSSSISGNVFNDFNDDGAKAGTDSGIGGVTMTLTGTAFDGSPITATATTAPDGSYTFPFIPQGTYTISRGAVGEPHVTDGTNTAGSAGGTPSGTTIGSIALGSNTSATGYLFAVVPTARIGIAKRVVSGPTTNPDGSFTVGFQLVVNNYSLEALNAISVTDPLAGAAPAFGTHVTLAAPASDAMGPGSYTIVAPPSGSCGGANGGFDGSGAQTVASGVTLAAGATCTLDLTIRVQPPLPLPGGGYSNQATVTGTGALSGQTSATNPQLSDLSNNGATADPNGNGIANEAGENTPTPVAPTYTSSLALVKTADTSAVASPPVVGNVVTYHYAVTNTGNVTLTNVTVADPKPGLTLTGSPIASLAPGATNNTAYTGTYLLTQPDVDAGQVQNQASATGTDPYGGTPSDLSGTATTNDTPLVTPLVQQPSIALVKTADASGVTSPAQVGQTISYSFTVTNTGNVTLTNVTLAELLPGATVTGGPIASLDPGQSDSTTFHASYQLTQADIDAGEVDNQARATGKPPSGADVTDLSGATVADDTPTPTPLAQSAGIVLVKTADVSAFTTRSAVVGDTLPFAFAVTNTGNVTLTNVTIADALPGVTLSGGPIASLAPGATDSTTITGSYTLTAADVAAGTVTNTATATGHYGPGGTLSVSGNSTTTANVLSVRALPETFPPFTTDGGTTTSVLASDTVAGGPATLANVSITVLAEDPGVTLDPATGLITLAPGQPAGQYNVTYQICSVTVPGVCSSTTETVTQMPLPAMRATKTQTVVDNGDGATGVGDTVRYTITVENTGNVALSGLTLADTMKSLAGTPLTLDTGPSFVSADMSSPEGSLQIGETATYSASYVLTIPTVSDGGVSNQVNATGLPVYPAGIPGTPSPISELSGNNASTPNHDPTVLRVDPSMAAVGLSITKTTPRGVVQRGNVVPYTLTVKNVNPFVSGRLNIVDALPPGLRYVPGSATLNGAAATVSVSGAVVIWRDVAVPPLTTVTATLSARVLTGAAPGEHVNRATIRDPSTNGLMAPQATATVRILPEAVFDCGDVIGKVFDDVNRDGYQNQGEAGIPAARLAGVDGTLITTDQYGRFHVPCAMLPQSRGSNFILKLDTRSLPTGYRVTTENPRVVRLTPGKMTEMNFGAAITHVARIDLNPRAFVTGADGKAALSPALKAGIAKLLPRIAAEAANIRLAYHLPPKAGDADLRRGRALMKLVKDDIRKRWKDVGQVKLTIEQTFVWTVE